MTAGDDEPTTSRARRPTAPLTGGAFEPKKPTRDDAVPLVLGDVKSSGPVLQAPRTRTGEYSIVTKKARAGSESEAPPMMPVCEVLEARDGMVKLRVNATILTLKAEDARALAEMIWRAVQRSSPF